MKGRAQVALKIGNQNEKIVNDVMIVLMGKWKNISPVLEVKSCKTSGLLVTIPVPLGKKSLQR